MERFSAIAAIIWKNLLGYDLIIFLVAAVALYCYLSARRQSEALYKLLHITIFVPEQMKEASTQEPSGISQISEGELVGLRKRANGVYTIFVNLTGIFTLLGILGTVISLLPMVADLANMQLNFFAALTSTFWGLVFAIIFKLLDGFLSPRMEDNHNNIELYLQRSKGPGEAPCKEKKSL